MIDKSLNNIMNKMARSTNVVFPSVVKSAPLKSLSELEAFAVLDNTLDALNKQYLDAKAQRKELTALSGCDDAMVEIAVDMEDSAWCAMQTRYLELRTKRKMMSRAQKMMRQRDRQIEELQERIAQSDKEKQARDFANYLKIMAVMKEKNTTPRIFEWLMVFLFLRLDFWGLGQHKRSYNFAAAA